MTTLTTLPFRPEIQGLRAIAILLVVLAHAEIAVFSGGFVGVDVFFVLSGYLITGLLVREYASRGTINFTGFFARRLKRLLPALLVMLCLVILISSVLLSSHEAREQNASAVYAATWTSNLYFAFSTLDYFAELKTRDLFLHTWSLGVEEQFYVVWPLLLLPALTLLTRYLGRDRHHKQLLFILGLFFVSSLGLSWYWTMTQSMWSFYLMPARIWQFSLGAGVFVWFRSRDQDIEGDHAQGLSRLCGVRCEFVGLILIIGSAVLLHPDLTYPGFWALLPSLGAALVIAAGHQTRARGSKGVIGHPALVWIGNCSYSWYLWHWPVLMLGFAYGMQYRLAETLGLVMLSLLLAVLSYRWVEQPFWKGRFSRAVPTRIILQSILAMLLVIAGTRNYFNLTQPAHDDAPQYLSPISAARSDVPIIYAHGCDAWYANADVRPCLFGESNAPKTVVLLGDSIGAQWFSLLPEIFPVPEWRIVVLTKSACAMVDEDYFYSRIGQIYTVCTQWRNAVLDYLASLQPDIIFLGSAATYDFSETQWIAGSIRVLTQLTEANTHVIVVPGTPHLSFDGPGCLARYATTVHEPAVAGISVCHETLTKTQAADVANYLQQAAQRFPNVSVLNLNDLVCPNEHCAAQDSNGFIVFRDSQHLTDSFVRAQAPKVMSRLKKLGLMVKNNLD
ncbi:MAG: acyltransferase family protein [Candidatus Competibacteraceae bacterium]